MIKVLIASVPNRTEALKRSIASIKASVCDQPIEILTEISSGEGATAPVIRLLKKVDGLAFLFSDDIILEPDCIQWLYNTYRKHFPEQDGICVAYDGFSEGHHPKNLFFFGHSKTLLENFYPGYFHNFADRELTDVMISKGKYLLVPEARIKHLHYTSGLSTIDETSKLIEEHSDADGALFYKRKAEGFPK